MRYRRWVLASIPTTACNGLFDLDVPLIKTLGNGKSVRYSSIIIPLESNCLTSVSSMERLNIRLVACTRYSIAHESIETPKYSGKFLFIKFHIIKMLHKFLCSKIASQNIKGKYLVQLLFQYRFPVSSSSFVVKREGIWAIGEERPFNSFG